MKVTVTNSRSTTLQKTLLILLLPVLLTAGAIYYNYHAEASANLLIQQSQEANAIHLARYRSNTEIANVISDVAYLARENYLQDWLVNGGDVARQSLEKEYLTFAQQKGIYDQIRFIDEQGQEVVRVNQKSGKRQITLKENLQDKSDRYYFTITLSLKRSQVYISPFDLNVEQGVIERPIKPVIRVGMPVFDDKGRKRGVVVVNYEGQHLLQAIRDLASQSAGGLWLLNSEGYWFLGPSRENEWAFMYPDRRGRTFADAYPAAWEKLAGDIETQQFMVNGDLFTSAAVSPSAISLAGINGSNENDDAPLLELVSQESWILLSRVPAATIAAGRLQLARKLATIFGILAILEFAAAWIVSRHWTARQKAEQSAVRSEANFLGLIEAAPDAILVADPAGKVRLVNEQAERLFGCERGQLVGQSVENLVPERYRARHADLRAGYLEEAEARQMGGESQLWARRSDGTELPVDIRLSTVASDRESLIFTSVRDVTDRYRKEQTIQEMADRLAHDNAALNSINAELDSFCYSVSHDLRAPLRSMAGFCQALVEDYGDKLDETGKDFVARISAASKRMGQLIDDLLILSRVTRTEVKRSDVDLSSMAEAVAEQLRQNAPDRDVDFKIAPGMTARGDETLLRTVLENLLGNAWKYSAKKSHATIEFGIAANGAEPTFYVSDDGVGFDMAHADKLFKPFQRLHRATEFEGTGIGLASVANIVRRHGGRVWADSALDAGTTMRFTLSS